MPVGGAGSGAGGPRGALGSLTWRVGEGAGGARGTEDGIGTRYSGHTQGSAETGGGGGEGRRGEVPAEGRQGQFPGSNFISSVRGTDAVFCSPKVEMGDLGQAREEGKTNGVLAAAQEYSFKSLSQGRLSTHGSNHSCEVGK